MDTLYTPDRHPDGCEIVVPIILKVPLYIEPVVIEKPPVCAGQKQAIVDSESELVDSEPEPILPQPIPVKPFDGEPAIFKSDFNFAAISLTQVWRLFSTAGRLGGHRS